jgi:hypothetical protein
MPVRDDIPIPAEMSRLPFHRGFPVPWFVESIDGVPDFRVMDGRKLKKAVEERRCWVCGGRMGQFMAYVAGPMCAVNRTSSEPPSHVRCAVYSARACPFLSRPHMRRREEGLPEEAIIPAGVGIMRNPKAAMVWIVRGKLKLKYDLKGALLFDLGEPEEVRWFSEGRTATRAEVDESIETGLPLLREQCHTPEAHAALERMTAAIEQFLPAAA